MSMAMDNQMNNYSIVYDEEIASLCVYGADFVKEILGIDKIYSPQPKASMSSRKLEGYRRLAKYRAYYQQNPVQFIRDFFNIQLLDSQAYLMQMAWNTPQVLIVASRAYGKSFWIVLFIMAKQMLSSYPWNCYIASGSSQQSATTFKKLEDIANDRIGSLLNSSGYIFKDEVEVPNASGDGFSHNPAGFEYKLHNGAFTRTLNSNVDKNRGARSDCVVFDECGFLSAELIQVYQAFCATDKEFKTGVNDDGSDIDNVRLNTLPQEIQNQLIYISSASSTDTEFYNMYREFSKKMILGDPNYFVAHIDCDLVMRPTLRGNKMKPALTQEKIDTALRTNPEKARREYYCEFTSDAGKDAIIRRGVIARNEEIRKPVLYNDTGNRKIVIAYDPARSRDNSVILVAEIYECVVDGKIEYKMRLLNCINLVDIEKKNKTPMTTPKQVEYLKQVILDYNQGGDENYSNILGIYIDAGSGGSGVNIADFLMPDWKDSAGNTHKGLIDKEYSKDYIKNFPNAVDKIHLMSPTQYKSEMYESLIEMLTQDLVSFTASYDNKGYLTIVEVDKEQEEEERKKIIAKIKKKNKKISDEELEEKVKEELTKSSTMKARMERLSWQEEVALASIDALKEEVVNMVRIRRESGKDSFELAPEKKNKMHDDRSYTLSMVCYALAQERRKNITNRKKPSSSGIADLLASQIKKSSRKIGMFNE